MQEFAQKWVRSERCEGNNGAEDALAVCDCADGCFQAHSQWCAPSALVAELQDVPEELEVFQRLHPIESVRSCASFHLCRAEITSRCMFEVTYGAMVVVV